MYAGEVVISSTVAVEVPAFSVAVMNQVGCDPAQGTVGTSLIVVASSVFIMKCVLVIPAIMKITSSIM
ncbi:uncharacterized protein N7500_000382 [Penicillium coprophilum]|uniref:uncharacterized protein n=1 Tax=Penicillium coprophilum TaxID=36646 RepID=UPI0023A1ACDF|nr:uncharacterized protein N7500_000382 [Penicillium coprophilum]KAJ5177683.1 hypothetical protein N7500_000382 [Penicillium coprophilum]